MQSMIELFSKLFTVYKQYDISWMLLCPASHSNYETPKLSFATFVGVHFFLFRIY